MSISSVNNNVSTLLNAVQRKPVSPEEHFKEMDSDGSGGIDKVEISDLAKKLSEMTGKEVTAENLIQTYDENGDSTLSQDEMKTAMEAMRPQGAPQGMPSGPPPGGGMNKAAMFNKMDADGSGGLDKDELSGLAQKISEDTGEETTSQSLIDKYDENGDGVLSADELQAMMEDLKPQQETEEAAGVQTVNAEEIQSQITATLLNSLDTVDNKDSENLFQYVNTLAAAAKTEE